MDDVDFQKKLLIEANLPCATIPTHGMGGMGRPLWIQPHNSRFYAFFKALGYGWRKEGELLNGGKEVLFRDFEGVCDIRLKKVQAEIFVKVLDKQWFNIDASDIEVASEVLKRRVRDEALRVWPLFCAKYNIQSDMVFVRERVEIGREKDLGKLNPAVVVSGLDWKQLYMWKQEANSWDALVERTKGENDWLGRIEGKIDDVRNRLPEAPAWRKACVVLDLVGGDPAKCGYAWKGLDGYDKEQFLDYWMEHYESVGVRR